MVQISEVLSLIFNSLGLIVVIALYRAGTIPRHPHLFAGFVCVWTGNVCTVAEGFIFYDLLNVMEHLFFVSAALLFCAGLLRHFRKPGDGLP